MTSHDLVRILLEEVYKLSSTQINLPPDLSNFVIEWGKLNIPDEDLFIDPEDGGKGRETESHITLLFGLKIPTPSPALRKIIESTPQFPIELGKVSLFESEDYDVVKLDVLAPELHALNARIAKAVPNEQTHPKYTPHCTIAYVRKSSANHLVGQDPFGEEAGAPRKFNASAVSFRGAGDSDDKERVVEEIPLMAERPEKAPNGMSYRVVWADGRGVQYFGNHSDALRFSKDKERDADPPKLVRRPKGAQLHEGVIETEANAIVDEIGRKMSEYGDSPKRFNAWAMSQPFKRQGIRFVRPRDDTFHGGYHLDKHHIQLDCWNPKWGADGYWHAIATSLPHELVHVEQHRRAGYRSDLGVGGALEPGYTDNPHEQMAQARSDAENVRRAKEGGIPVKTKDLIRQHYIHGSPISSPSFAGKKRYGKRLYQYLEPIVNEDEDFDPKAYAMAKLPPPRCVVVYVEGDEDLLYMTADSQWHPQIEYAKKFANKHKAQLALDAYRAWKRFPRGEFSIRPVSTLTEAGRDIAERCYNGQCAAFKMKEMPDPPKRGLRESLRTLRDLRAMPDDQLYLCSDQHVAEKHQLTIPFKCGCRQWIGGGLVAVEFHSNREGYTGAFQGSRFQASDYANIRTLEPVVGETWQFYDPPA